jgi:hypothetical protein
MSTKRVRVPAANANAGPALAEPGILVVYGDGNSIGRVLGRIEVPVEHRDQLVVLQLRASHSLRSEGLHNSALARTFVNHG